MCGIFCYVSKKKPAKNDDGSFSWIAVVSITTTQYSVKKRQVVSMSTAMRALIRASRTLLMRVDITT